MKQQSDLPKHRAQQERKPGDVAGYTYKIKDTKEEKALDRGKEVRGGRGRG